jgi:anthranilate synthase/phosphoribosyltransferase
MLVIVNNGKGAENISRFMRVQHKIIKPKDKIPEKVSGVIFSDGKISKDAQLKAKMFIDKGTVPVMFVGNGYRCMMSCMNTVVKEIKVSKKQERLIMAKPCPLLLDVKKAFSVIKDADFLVSNLPENLNPIARSQKNEFEMVQDIEKPFFGLNFNPELGLDGFKILQNFSNFIEVWEKYHK